MDTPVIKSSVDGESVIRIDQKIKFLFMQKKMLWERVVFKQHFMHVLRTYSYAVAFL